MKELTVQAALCNTEAITDFIDEELTQYHCPPKARMQIDIAIDEIFSNISRYAYGAEHGDATVRIEVEEDPLRVILTFIDSGAPFNPLKRSDPDTSLPAEERTIGGLGIFMVKKTMDAIDYQYSGGRNILTIKKLF